MSTDLPRSLPSEPIKTSADHVPCCSTGIPDSFQPNPNDKMRIQVTHTISLNGQTMHKTAEAVFDQQRGELAPDDITETLQGIIKDLKWIKDEPEGVL